MNAIPGNSRYKFDLSRLSFIDKELPDKFIRSLLSEQPLKFRISWKENVPDVNLLFEADQIQLVRITKAFENLINQTETIESEKGINTFGFGFPILVRRDLADNKLTVAPILIWSLRIKRTKEFNTWEINRTSDDPIYLNEVLINHLHSDANVEISQIPNELIDDGLINAQQLIGICTDLLRSINTTVSQDVVDTLKTKLDKVIAIGDRNHYERLPAHSSNAFIDFGGLFSIFEVQKQNIINDYDSLMGLEGQTIDLEDMENHSFQPISSVETDPSQQRILHSLETSRNILIQGPPGTGKSQTLTAILINALENHKKTIVVCEKRTALEVLHKALLEKGLNYHCVLIKDIVKDRRVVVDSVRDRIDTASYRRNRFLYSKESLDSVLNKAKKLIESINGKHKKLDEKILGDKSWTHLVGALLSELNSHGDESKLNLDPGQFDFTALELNTLTEIVQTGQSLYERYRPYENLSFLNSAKLIGPNPYIVEQQIHGSFGEYTKSIIEIGELETRYRNEYSKIRVTEFRKQIAGMEVIMNSITEICNRNRENGDFLNEAKTTGLWYRLGCLFSGTKKLLIQDQKRFLELLNALVTHLNGCHDLDDFVLAGTLGSNMASIEKAKEQARSKEAVFQQRVNGEYLKLNLLAPIPQVYETETLMQLRQKTERLHSLVTHDQWIDRAISQVGLHDFVNNVSKLLQAKHDYFSNQNDLFSAEFRWFQFYNALDKNAKALVHNLKGKAEWRKCFVIYYLHSMLVRYANLNLPVSDDELTELDVTLGKLEKEQLKYVKEYWYSKQIDASRDFEQRNSDLAVENLYNKKSGNRFKRLSLRQIVQYDADLFTTFFPIILTTPDVCCNLFKVKNRFFDIVMFDEASQLRLEDNLPAILKGKQIIISGDEHQMPPSNYFSKVFDGSIEDEEEIEEEDEITIDRGNMLLSCESLLDFGSELRFEKRHLDFHYRSRHPYLIDFSNYAFYNQRLKPLPTTLDYIPIKYIPVNGTFSEHINDTEAEMVLAILEKNIHRMPNGEYPTVGVATFNIMQRNHIKSKILERQKFQRYDEFNSKIQELEENGMFIKNLENIQGDERDVIILSTTYGPGSDGRFAQRFGPINHSKGYKLLNVIITRAKYKIYVCSSVPEEVFMNYHDYLVVEGSNNKRAVFYAYLAYTKAVSSGDTELRQSVLKALSDNSTVSTSFDIERLGELESPFEEEVYHRLSQVLGEQNLRLQYPVSEFRIDIVYDPKMEGVPKIAIECDGSKYHSSREAYLYDRHRQKILEDHGFVFHRIWSTNWWRDPQRETQRLVDFIRSVEEGNIVSSIVSDFGSAFTHEVEVVENLIPRSNTRQIETEKKTLESFQMDAFVPNHKDTVRVRFNSEVKIRSMNNSKDMRVQIIEGAVKNELVNGVQRIKAKSPLAVSILGHQVGDIVKVGDLDNFVEIIEIVS